MRTGSSSFSSRVAWHSMGSGFSPQLLAGSVYFALICANSWQVATAVPDLCWQDRLRSQQLPCPCFMEVEAEGNRIRLVPAVLQQLAPEAGLILRKAPDPAAGSDEGRRAEEATCLKAAGRYEAVLELVLASLERRQQQPALQANCSCSEKGSCYGA